MDREGNRMDREGNRMDREGPTAPGDEEFLNGSAEGGGVDGIGGWLPFI